VTKRERITGFFAAITVGFAAIVVVLRLVEPEMTSHWSFWRDVVGGTVAIFAFVYIITPRRHFWAPPIPDEPARLR
jgi:undecaprenyl pyrophosphate phosphatase UppP